MTWRIFQSPIPAFNISLLMTYKILTPKWQNATENCLSEYLRCSVGLHTTLTHVDLHTTPMHKSMYTLAQLQPVYPSPISIGQTLITIRKTFEQLDVQNMLN